MKDYVDDLKCGWRMRICYLYERKTKRALNQADPEFPVSIAFDPSEQAAPLDLQILGATLDTLSPHNWELDADSKQVLGKPIRLSSDRVDIDLCFCGFGLDRIDDSAADDLSEDLKLTLELRIGEDDVETKRYQFVRAERGGHFIPPLQWTKVE